MYSKKRFTTKMGEIANSVNSLDIERKDNSIVLWPTVISLEIFAQAPDQTNILLDKKDSPSLLYNKIG